jgi:hypothetical protein
VDPVRSFLEDNNDKIKENTKTAKFAKETKKVIDAKNIVYSANIFIRRKKKNFSKIKEKKSAIERPQ